jgi:hypothetical protein
MGAAALGQTELYPGVQPQGSNRREAAGPGKTLQKRWKKRWSGGPASGEKSGKFW